MKTRYFVFQRGNCTLLFENWLQLKRSGLQRRGTDATLLVSPVRKETQAIRSWTACAGFVAENLVRLSRIRPPVKPPVNRFAFGANGLIQGTCAVNAAFPHPVVSTNDKDSR